MAPQNHDKFLLDSDISYDMERLFDPYNLDHIPVEKRLELFKQRDLAHIKHYKAAVKIFGGPPKRTRIIIAPSMETPFKHRLGLYHNVAPLPPPLVLNNSLKPPQEIIKEPSKEEKDINEENEKRCNYKSWMTNHKKIRNDLDNMNLNEAFLARKTNKSEIEKRVESKLRASRLCKLEPSSLHDVALPPKPRPPVPVMTLPPPEGLEILDRFLTLNQIRLIDLFLLADTDKSWSISREKFLKLITKYDLPLSENEVDDLILSLDTDSDDKLNYQDLNKGLTEWRKQRRNAEKQSLSISSSSSNHSKGNYKKLHTPDNENEVFDDEHNQEQVKDSVQNISPTDDKKRMTSAKNSRPVSCKTLSSSRTSTPHSLELPELDLRQEAMVPSSPEALVDHRKHNRVVLSRNNLKRSMSPEQRLVYDDVPGVIKIGYKPIDDHCSESTLGGEVASHVNQFRREKLKEYFDVKKLFEDSGLPFTLKSLDRVLLYPGDKPTHSINGILGLPNGSLMGQQSTNYQSLSLKTELKNKYNTNSPRQLSAPFTGPNSSVSKLDNSREAARYKSKDRGAAHKNTNEINNKRKNNSKQSKKFKHRYVKVEDVYPLAAKVLPIAQEEELSSGLALIKRKVDNWMTFEEYSKYTKKLQKKFQHNHLKSNPSSDWSGYLLDKLRLCMDNESVSAKGNIHHRDSLHYEGIGTGMYNGLGTAVFHHTAQPKRAYHGYNNDLQTWPIGENGVRYGNIDEHRIIR